LIVLETIVSDLLEISKFETGRIQLEKAAFDVVKLIKKVIFHYQILADEFKVSIKVTLQMKMNILYLQMRVEFCKY
jgi:signal transduction histidine kinase